MRLTENVIIASFRTLTSAVPGLLTMYFEIKDTTASALGTTMR